MVGLAMFGLNEARIAAGTILDWQGNWLSLLHLTGRALGLAIRFVRTIGTEPAWRRFLEAQANDLPSREPT